ncbi:MAG: 4-alpha-glucanotransferase [Candidatus Dormibacteria bacterium]
MERALDAMGADSPSPERSAGPPSRRPGDPLARCYLPPLKPWGWAAQLYALRSETSWGMGDLADLRALSDWSRGLGARALLINPLHAPRPVLPQEASPYFPSSRRFRNPLYLAVEDVPGSRDAPDVARMAREARALNTAPEINRDRIYALKMDALARLWERFTGDAGFTAYCAARGDELLRYACFCVLCERFTVPWQRWPTEFRHPQSAAVRRLAETDRGRVDFHRWLQWLLEQQLLAAARGGIAPGPGADRASTPAVIHDVAVGFAPDGADAWEWQDLLAPGMTVGAPPDEYLLDGQNWGVPAFDPHKLRAAGYEPLRQTLRGILRPGHGIRIDHVMGLFRLWWVPEGRSAADGVYVRFPADELLDIVATESTDSRTFVIGEDLGTVEDGVRAELRRRNVLSCRVAWFESRSPLRYPARAVAAMTTHDLPTVAGVWSGDDIRELQELGVHVNMPAEQRLRRRLQRLAGVNGDAPLDDVITRAYTALGTAPSDVVLATLDDAAAAPRRPNVPGTVNRPNWSIPLTRTLEQLRDDRLPRRIARALGMKR